MDSRLVQSGIKNNYKSPLIPLFLRGVKKTKAKDEILSSINVQW